MPDIRNDDDGRHIATHFPASEEAVNLLLGRPVHDDGRSDFVWLRLANGDLVLGIFPQGETYFELEETVEADYENSLSNTPTPGGTA